MLRTNVASFAPEATRVDTDDREAIYAAFGL